MTFHPSLRLRALPLRAAALTAATVAGLAAGSSGALAHTGHGHDELSTFEGLLHALREPDHLAMVALGIVIAAVAAPFVLRVAARVGRAIAKTARRARRGVAG